MAIPALRADLARERIRLAASQQARARARAGLAWKHPSSGRSTRDPPLREHPIYYIFVRPHHAYSRHTLTPYPSREACPAASSPVTQQPAESDSQSTFQNRLNLVANADKSFYFFFIKSYLIFMAFKIILIIKEKFIQSQYQ